MTFLLPTRLRACSAALLLCAAVGLCAQKVPTPSSKPETLKTPVGTTEIGLLDGAAYRIDVPTQWNHSLIVYYHGYSESIASFQIAERLNAHVEPLFERHYAIVQSGYSQRGWALEQAYPETESLRRYFAKAYGEPLETYAVGGSMGGALVMVTLELNPKPYTGGLDLCGAVGPTYESFERRFAYRAAFDFYFPGIMPPLAATPASFENSREVHDKISAALKANPTGAAAMRSLMGLHVDAEVAHDIGYFTFVIADMQRRAKGNPFDNRNYLYTGTTPGSSASDYALNDGVKRYVADPSAYQYLAHHYTPSGHLNKPMLALHTLYDPLINPTTLSLYAHQVEFAGFSQNLIQQYVHRDGHCTFTQDEIGLAFDELVRWTHNGARPKAGLLPEPRTEPQALR